MCTSWFSFPFECFIQRRALKTNQSRKIKSDFFKEGRITYVLPMKIELCAARVEVAVARASKKLPPSASKKLRVANHILLTYDLAVANMALICLRGTRNRKVATSPKAEVKACLKTSSRGQAPCARRKRSDIDVASLPSSQHASHNACE